MDLDQHILTLYILITLQAGRMRDSTGEKAGLSSRTGQRNITEAENYVSRNIREHLTTC